MHLCSYIHTKTEPPIYHPPWDAKAFIFSELITEVSAIFTFCGCKVTTFLPKNQIIFKLFYYSEEKKLPKNFQTHLSSLDSFWKLYRI